MISDIQPVKRIRLLTANGSVYHKEFKSVQEVKDTWKTSYNLRWTFKFNPQNVIMEISLTYTTPWKLLDQLEL